MKTMIRVLFAGLCAGALASCNSGGHTDPPLVKETFVNPTELRSANGELRTTFTVASAQVRLADRTVTTAVYNGAYVPPVLRLRPGDTLLLDLVNRYSEQTNLHLHGLNVSPLINADATVGDNVFVSDDPGFTISYRVPIPAIHNPGLYWYHTHLHEKAQRQVMGGMSGGIIIDGILDPLPQLQNVKERILLLKDIQITAQGTVPEEIDPSAPSTRMVNGLVNPIITIRPNETQFFRIANVGSDLYYKLTLPGHVFYELAIDGNRRNQLVARQELLIPPSSRAEVLIQGGAPGGYALAAAAMNTGPAGDTYPAATIATIVSQGEPAELIPLPSALPAVDDLRTATISRRRTITFTESADGNTFFIDSGNGPKQFNPNVVDSTIPLGSVEEWTLLNATQELHTFHIHQTDFQVTEINGVAQPFLGHQDNVNLPFQPTPDAAPGVVKVLIDFRNPIIVGKFVYHCHILEHEDGGMMAVAEVPPPLPAGPFANGLRKAIDRVLQPETVRQAALAEQTLNAIQSGSFCRTAPALPEVKIVRAGSAPKSSSNATTGMRKVRAP